MNNIWIFSEFFYVWLVYICKSLWIISLVWPTRLIFLAMGEVLSFGFNLAVLNPNDRKGTDTYYIVAIEDKKDGVYIILHEFIPLHNVILLKALLCSYELNTIDACWIVVDVWSNSSRCRIISVYLTRTWCLYFIIMPRYSHNYALFYQLLDSNLFTHRNTYAILREATSETYGPRVYLLSYKFPIYLLCNLYFQSIL